MRNGLRKGIFVVSLCVFVGSLSVIGYKGIYEPLRNRNAVEQVQQIYHTEEDDKDRTSSSQVPEKPQRENGMPLNNSRKAIRIPLDGFRFPIRWWIIQ